QGCFVSDHEVESVVGFVKENSDCNYDSDVEREIEQAAAQRSKEKGDEGGGSDGGGSDDMMTNAIDVVVEAGMASTSLLQRRLRIGYGRAARIIDEMEERGIVGPMEGSKARTVLLTRQQWYEMKMRLENE
ncbi:MAG: DNA translocase FtsK, partial [Clostridia bacterium]|nr:DNA translocase FtsK [Clostridia bacterium]